ncbi:MAG: hypothetical protein IH623_20625 [Verrucomicrobia bacterium]|nr:hypothetical protein [Verrucomicrobiota bacterium]
MNMKTLPLCACVAGCALVVNLASANLIVNGDFQSGDTGFNSDYSSTLGIGFTEGTYAILNNPHGPAPYQNPWAASYFDHTYGDESGLMMAVNGATVPGMTVWAQSLSGLTVGQQYVFSLWLSSWVATSGSGNAVLDIQIDGLSQATFYAPTTAGVWERRSFAWTAASSSMAFAAIFNTETATYPNDFALDDLALVAFSGQHLNELVSAVVQKEISARVQKETGFRVSIFRGFRANC